MTDIDLTTDETFPWLGTDRERTRTECPSCGSMVENTPRSFCAHWATSSGCSGPPRRRPRGLTDTSRVEWRALVDAVRAVDSFTELVSGTDAVDRPPSDPRVGQFLDALDGIDDGSFPWLTYPDRGWEVPCPACGRSVFNERDAFVAHWCDNADCDGPMTVPAGVWRMHGLSVRAADLGQPPEADTLPDDAPPGTSPPALDGQSDGEGADIERESPRPPSDATGHAGPDDSDHNSDDSDDGADDSGRPPSASDDTDDAGDDADGDWYGYSPYGNC